MSINSTSGAKVYIGPPSATISTLVEYNAITTALGWIEIGECEDLGEWGPEATELPFKNVGDKHVRRVKGSIDSGMVELICARDPLDLGQIAARASVEDNLPCPIRVLLNDKPTPSGDPTEFFFRAVVLSAKNKLGEGDNITRTTFRLGIDGKVIEVPASV